MDTRFVIRDCPHAMVLRPVGRSPFRGGVHPVAAYTGAMAFEHHRQPLASRRHFARRLLKFAGYSAAFLAVSLSVGVVGYHGLCGLGWVDAVLNASMILTGMGPVSPMPSDAAKLFASAYAVFSGVAFLTTFSILIAPVLHRVLHRLHLNEDAE
jgi:hypothetical protein